MKPAEPKEILNTNTTTPGEGAKSPRSPPTKDLERHHLHLFTDRLALKVEELEQLSATIEIEVAERARLEHELSSTREQLRQLLDQTPAAIYSLRVEGQSVTLVFVSENIERLLGVTVEECTREWWLESLHPDDRERFRNNFQESLAGHGYAMEYRLRHRNGRYHWVEDKNRLIRDANGVVTESVGVWTDITERKASDEIIRTSEQRFSSFMDNVPGFAWMKDSEGRYVYGNKFFEELASGREWRGRTVDDVWPPEIAASLHANDAMVIETKAPLQTIEMILQSGEPRAVMSSKFPILNGNGEVAFVCGIGIDVSERTQAEQRLREQARLLDLAQDAIMVRDMDDRVDFWNHGAEELYGWTAAEVQGKKASDFLYDDDPAVTAAAHATVIKDGKWTGERTHNCRDGGTVTVRSRWTLVRDELGVPKSVLIINTDVTEQKRLVTHLLRAQRLESMGTLASGVAHDLNNILTPILICAGGLRGEMTIKERASTVALIEECARRGVSVVKQVLTFARGVQGDRVSIKPSHLIQEIVAIARKTFPKSITITNNCPDDLWSLKGDPTQLHQVLLNISVNARDAMLAGGTLGFVSENIVVDPQCALTNPEATSGPHVLLQISDTGSGMPRATIDKIFDPFFTTKAVGHGTGLGLSTALGIVRSHGGFISVTSEMGRGTTFKIFLPAEVSASQEASAAQNLLSPEQSADPDEGHGELILVVDDEENIREATKAVLERSHYRVVSASDGAEAVAIFEQLMESIKVVLTDISMPHMDGVAAVRAIKQIKPGVPFIVFTGDTQQPRLKEFQAMNVNNFLIKPFTRESLLEAVQAAIGASPGGEIVSKTITD